MGPDLLHLSAAGVSLVLDCRGPGLPTVAHWGAALDGTLDDLLVAVAPQPIGFSVDGTVRPSLVPEQSSGWLGTPGLAGHRDGQAWATAFEVTAIEQNVAAHGVPEKGGPEVGRSADTVRITATDPIACLDLSIDLELHPSGVLRARGALTSTAPGTYWLEHLTIFLPVPERTTELLDFTGHHLRERHPQRTAFTHGLRVRENRTGRTGYDAAYLLCAGTSDFAHRRGEIWALHTAFSGGARSIAERTYHGWSALAGGELLLPGEVGLAQGQTYQTPWVYAVHSAEGLDGVAARFHRYLRARPHHPAKPRPVVVNTWEAVYFDHDLTKLTDLARAAAAIGAERFVLDDGWFGSRRDDTSGLGDWTVSPDVWPDGLGPLITVVRDLGMEFGLWVEPEMINPDSDLAREHPDWIMATGTRLPRTARSQQVLDLANPRAYAYILDRLGTLLTEHDIAYLKWDHNRDLVEAGHPGTGRAGVHDQTHAVYRLLDELRARHPGVEIESCSSGGGRVDLAILERTDRVWASDCIDAHERVAIQRWTSLLVPLELIGSHIGAPLCHTTHRELPLSMRAGTAIWGHLGVEWDLTGADESSLVSLAAWVALYKELRGLLHTGTLVHADLADPAFEVTGVVAADGSDALFALIATGTSASYPPGTAALPGLDPDRTYHVRPQPPGDVADGNAAAWGAALPWCTPQGVRLNGRTLGTAGLRLPVLFPDRVLLVRVTAVQEDNVPVRVTAESPARGTTEPPAPGTATKSPARGTAVEDALVRGTAESIVGGTAVEEA
ncbi:alpha-galactosidase [Actinoplanes awajinensis]|uniref:alpha-galactosidase n=1 Tax=Actinoplanes awajinensis subsp. mycoplanecinus TaxID=135947 RepID=A0A0X3VBN1_9ACTN|nr:alpha-galactosidase [Actinoplanes awajinensis]KUL42150.1 alpha-galactosidase [Actinoplanes awajinensis subsp. mycoplanecinus]